MDNDKIKAGFKRAGVIIMVLLTWAIQLLTLFLKLVTYVCIAFTGIFLILGFLAGKDKK